MSQDHPLSSFLPDDLLTDLLSTARAKARSTETHDNVHIPDLKLISGSINCLLLGDSMLERFKTTGSTTTFGPEPNTTRATTSSTLLVTHADDGAEIASGTASSSGPSVPSTTGGFTDPSLIPSYNPTTGIFNAGVGGDSLKNIIYRLTGTPANPGGLLYSLLSLPASHQPQYIFLLAGTNDLDDRRRPLPATSLSLYRLLINTLAHAFPQAKICVCGLMPKLKVKKATVVEESNVLLRDLVMDMNNEKVEGQSSVEFLPTDKTLGLAHLEDDSVHLNSDGYQILGMSMWLRLESMKTTDMHA